MSEKIDADAGTRVFKTACGLWQSRGL